MKKLLLLTLCLIMLCGCKQSSQSNEDKQTEITNNTVILENEQSLKPGQPFDDPDTYLQEHETLETESSAVFYTNEDAEIFVGMDGSVKKITLLTDTYHLDNELKVGSSKNKVQKAYQHDPSAQDSSALTYQVDDIEITFSLKDDKVTKIELQQ